LKLDSALLGDRSLLDRNHLPFELTKFGRSRPIATNEKRGWPEHDDGNAGGDGIVASLGILRAGDLGCSRRYALRL